MRQRSAVDYHTITDSSCLGHRDESEVPPLPLLLGYALADDGELFVGTQRARAAACESHRRRAWHCVSVLRGTTALEPRVASSKILEIAPSLVCRQKSPTRPYQPNASLGLPTATDNQATDRPTDHACETFKSWETSHFSRKL